MHHEDFQKLEGAWRGLHYLVNNTETDEMLKIRFMNISKTGSRQDAEAATRARLGTRARSSRRSTKRNTASSAASRSAASSATTISTTPPPDVELLGEMAQVAAAAHTPFITGASPTIMQMSIVAGTGQSARSHEDLHDAGIRRVALASRIGGLAVPRVWPCRASSRGFPTGRRRIRSRTSPSRKTPARPTTASYTWANAAYAMATNINRSFKLYGWCSRIRGVESGGAVEGLPVHTFPTDDGGVDMKCPTEIAISDRREAELAKNGFMPLLHRKNSDFAAFIGAQSVQKPFEYTDPDATANANLAARLPYLFACCRFAHYLKCIVRDKIGSFKEREDMQVWLQKWIMNYVDGDPAHSSETTKAQKPLAAAEVQVAGESKATRVITRRSSSCGRIISWKD